MTVLYKALDNLNNMTYLDKNLQEIDTRSIRQALGKLPFYGIIDSSISNILAEKINDTLTDTLFTDLNIILCHNYTFIEMNDIIIL